MFPSRFLICGAQNPGLQGTWPPSNGGTSVSGTKISGLPWRKAQGVEGLSKLSAQRFLRKHSTFPKVQMMMKKRRRRRGVMMIYYYYSVHPLESMLVAPKHKAALHIG